MLQVKVQVAVAAGQRQIFLSYFGLHLKAHVPILGRARPLLGQK
jgi:hypothetical protein